MPSRATRERPILARLLTDFVKHEVPDFEFTSIQVNKDYAAALHVDKNNAGTSMIIGLGDYSGGQLWIDEGGRFGRVVDLRNRWFKFDGNIAHGVLPFRGRRYTLVYFTRSALHGGRVGERHDCRDAKRLSSLGFALPRVCPKELHFPPAVVRVEAAHNKFEEFCNHTLRRGGPGRIRLRLRFTDGRIIQVSILSFAPLKTLMEGVAQHFSGTCPQAVQLKVGSFPLLPSDTARGLGLSSKSIIDIVGDDNDQFAEDCGPQAAEVPSLKASLSFPRRNTKRSHRQIDGIRKESLELESPRSKRIKLQVASTDLEEP